MGNLKSGINKVEFGVPTWLDKEQMRKFKERLVNEIELVNTKTEQMKKVGAICRLIQSEFNSKVNSQNR